jgi:hypothetical protein
VALDGNINPSPDGLHSERNTPENLESSHPRLDYMKEICGWSPKLRNNLLKLYMQEFLTYSF